MIQMWSIVKNEALHVEEMLRSVIGQTHAQWRLIVSDNFSTDGTGDIVRRYCDIDERITLVHPPEPMSGMSHANWLWGMIANNGPADATMHVGGHDVISNDYVAGLWRAMASTPGVVCAYPKAAYQINDHGHIVGKWGSCPQTVGVAQPFKLLSMFTAMAHNVPFFGLMRWDAFTAVAPTRCCTSHDHFVCAELTLLGDVLEVDGPTLLLRRSPGFGDINVYRAKHMAGMSVADDLRQQFDWLASLVRQASCGWSTDLEHAYMATAFLSYVLSRVPDLEVLATEFPEVYALVVANVHAGRAITEEKAPCQ